MEIFYKTECNEAVLQEIPRKKQNLLASIEASAIAANTCKFQG
jgi:hypothetical protein